MLTLVLETSTTRGGVALFREEALVFAESFTADRSHTSQLFAVMERALAASTPERIVVGLGPGSYAGVRIAISAAMGLAVATGAELLGMASTLGLGDEAYYAIGDARRGVFYFAHVAEGLLREGPLLLTGAELEVRLRAPEVAGGRVKVFASEEMRMPGVEMRMPEVTRLGRLAVRGKGIWARGVLEPIYLREAFVTVGKLQGVAGP